MRRLGHTHLTHVRSCTSEEIVFKNLRKNLEKKNNIFQAICRMNSKSVHTRKLGMLCYSSVTFLSISEFENFLTSVNADILKLSVLAIKHFKGTTSD